MDYIRQPAARFPKAQAIGEVLSTTVLAAIGVCVAVLAWAAFTGPADPETSLEPITSAGTQRAPEGFFSAQPAGGAILIVVLSAAAATEAEAMLFNEARIRKLAGEPLRAAWVVTARDADEAAAIAESAGRDAQLPGAQQVTVVLLP